MKDKGNVLNDDGFYSTRNQGRKEIVYSTIHVNLLYFYYMVRQGGRGRKKIWRKALREKSVVGKLLSVHSIRDFIFVLLYILHVRKQTGNSFSPIVVNNMENIDVNRSPRPK